MLSTLRSTSRRMMSAPFARGVSHQAFPAASATDKIHPQQATLDEMFNNKNLKPRSVPIQLRNSGDGPNGTPDEAGMYGSGLRLLIDTRVRKGPFWHLSQEEGAWCYQIYNKVYHPRAYVKPEDGGLWKEYEALTKHVTMWNVAVERQIMVKGPDAVKFVNQVITRKAEDCKVMAARYVILCNQHGGILNDPIMLRPAEDEYWFSLSDTDICLWLQGVNFDGKYNVDIREIDVAPVQIQGPKAPQLLEKLVGPDINKVKYYGLMNADIGGAKTIISRTGWSTEKGYEIYLYNATRDAEKMWRAIKAAGEEFGLKVIAPGHHRRIEAGILSYGQDLDIETNPYECGLGWMCDFTKDSYIGMEEHKKIAKTGVAQKLIGMKINGGKKMEWYISDFYHIRDQETNEIIGYVTSAWYSPEQQCNIALGYVPTGLNGGKDYTSIGAKFNVCIPDVYKDDQLGNVVPAETCQTPFKMPDTAELGSGLRQTGGKL